MKNLIKLTTTLAMASVIATPVWAGKTQTLTDDAGRKVTVPVQPQSVISGHDAIISPVLLELGLPIKGSTMRTDAKTGKHTIFGIQQLFNTTVEKEGIKYVGGRKGLEFETIRSLNPDLFIGYEGMQKYESKFKGIAPVFINAGRKSSGNQAEYLIAKRFGKMDKYNELNTKYQKRLAEVKGKLPFDPKTKTYVDVLVSDKITAMNYIGGINKVMNDLGFKTPDFIKGTVGRAVVSPEELKKIDVDVVFMSTMYSKADRKSVDTDNALSKVAPGWDKFMKAKRENRIVYYDSYYTLSPTFASAMNTLDYLEKQFAK